MKNDLASEHPELLIQLLAVNAYGYSSGLSAMAAKGDLPLLQDHPEVNAWGLWRVSLRDLVIANRENQLFAVYNLGEHSLGDPDNFDTLEALLIAATED